MKIRMLVVLLATMLLVTGCGQGDKINASSNKTLYRSMIGLKGPLPERKRVEFEVSFWSLKQTSAGDKPFRSTVGGKTVDEIIAMGRDNFAQRTAAGEKGYDKYNDWDSMIDTLVKERSDVRIHGQKKIKGMNKEELKEMQAEGLRNKANVIQGTQ